MSEAKYIKVPLPANFSFRECCWFLDRGYNDCMHSVRENTILKTLRIQGKPALIRIAEEKTSLRVDLLLGPKDDEFIKNYIVGWLDLERDLTPFYHLLTQDKRLRYMTTAFTGLRLIGIVDLFEALCWSVIGQQINLTFAHTLKRRLVEQYGEKLSHDGQDYHLFPSCEILAAASVEELRQLQLSRSKAAYLIGLGSAFAQGQLSREILLALPDVETRQKALTALKGIGIWTANYTLMKTLREPSSIPHGDTGLLTALARHGVIKERSEIEKISRFFSKYAGWESYLVFYLWRSLSDPTRPAAL